MQAHSLRLGAVAAAIALSVGSASAADVKLPPNISWTAYGTTSSGYAQSVGLGKMLKEKYNADLRIIPGKNDVSRMAPMKAGQTPLCACGIAAYFAQEGVLMFATKEWGPMNIYNLFNNVGRNGQQLMTAADANIKTPADLKGKRVTWVKGADALNKNAEAMLAFGGLTWKDVQKVEVPGWGQSIQAVINGQADAAHGSTISSAYAQLAASPRGLYFPPLPHGDAAAWQRAQDVAPWWVKTKITAFTKGAKNEGPFEGNNYPYPLFVAMNNTPDDLAYGLTKAVMENYESFKENGPGMDGYKLENQALAYVFPYHPASVKYFKEKGVWTAEHEKNNATLMKRQQVLADAWKAMMAKNVADDQFTAEWLKVRAAALKKAGMPVVFE
ncbi:MAG: TAXI family TRAP transporter solute-binding subunit [Quisquiliibacterium sp.]